MFVWPPLRIAHRVFANAQPFLRFITSSFVWRIDMLFLKFGWILFSPLAYIITTHCLTSWDHCQPRGIEVLSDGSELLQTIIPCV
jgi:hypothetical protein